MGLDFQSNMKLPDSVDLGPTKRRVRRQSSAPESDPLEEGHLGEDPVINIGTPGPKKTGVVSMLQPVGDAHIKLRVRLSVHESYAVVAPDKDMCRDMGYVNLRHSTVQRIHNTNAFQIVPQDCDANVLTFYTQDSDVEDWLKSLQTSNRSTLRRPSRPSTGPKRRWSAPGGCFMPSVTEED